MSLRAHLAVIVLLPILLVGGLMVAGLKVPVPQWGRDYVLSFFLPDASPSPDLPAIYGSEDTSDPLVVIDAGHGGRDLGAVGAGVQEKNVTLGLALALRDELIAQGDIRVALTREDDRLLTLDERPDIARRMEADLFLSIHADSAGDNEAVSGASIYTLSNRASSAAAARFARRENDADRINGISINGENDEVSAILVELSQRRSQSDSVEFASLVTREGEGELPFHSQAQRAADLVVLRTPDMPSALFESGFVTNEDDAARLMSEEGQAQFARTMARAIRVFFIRRGEI
ncbi:N-acetylmuramoyl-L-alanine amidase [Altererythrobacter insulae]|nr:N-acetylmuramoyl-L-alanine amidase [Altererythrobacter insulae]